MTQMRKTAVPVLASALVACLFTLLVSAAPAEREARSLPAVHKHFVGAHPTVIVIQPNGVLHFICEGKGNDIPDIRLEDITEIHVFRFSVQNHLLRLR